MQGKSLQSTPQFFKDMEMEEKTMSRIKTLVIDLEVEGISPMLQDAMSEEEVERVLVLRQRRQPNIELTRKERCEPKVYVNPDPKASEEEKYGVPAENFLAALRGAGRKVKVGKTQVSTAKATNLFSFLSLREVFLPFLPEFQTWVPDVRRGVMRNTSSATTVGITRPKFPKWSFKCTLEVDLDGMEGVGEDTVKALVQRAGTSQGLCAFRPSCNGPFGRFKIKSWLVTQYDAKGNMVGSKKSKAT
jgi:hypothetical protein